MPSSPTITSDATATFQAYAELVTKTDDTAVADADLGEIAGAAVFNFYDTCLEQINEACNGERVFTDAGVTARFAGAPATGYNAGANSFVYGDGTGDFGQSVFIGASSVYRNYVRTSGGVAVGGSLYLAASGTTRFRTGNANVIDLTTTYIAPTTAGLLDIGDPTLRFDAGYFAGTLYVADAPTSGYTASADDLCIGDGSTSFGMSFYSGSSSTPTIAFRDPGSNVDGYYQFSHQFQVHRWGIAGTNYAQLNSSAYSPASAGGLTLGTSSLPWGELHISDGVTAPSTPTNSAVIYVDSADGDLKVKFSDGTTKTIVTDT